MYICIYIHTVFVRIEAPTSISFQKVLTRPLFEPGFYFLNTGNNNRKWLQIDHCALSKRKASLESTTFTVCLDILCQKRTLGENREQPTLFFRSRRGRCCWPLFHWCCSYTLSLSCGFLFDIADLLLIIDTPP